MIKDFGTVLNNPFIFKFDEIGRIQSMQELIEHA